MMIMHHVMKTYETFGGKFLGMLICQPLFNVNCDLSASKAYNPSTRRTH